MCRGSAFAYRNAAVPLGKDIGGVIAIVFGTGECDADMIAFMDQLMQRAISHDLRSPLAAIAAACCALSKARSDPPDLFLLDLGLPDMDGLQVIQQLRTQTRRPIIILSARAQENEKVLALDYGADDYVTKPFGAKELKARIRSALRHTYISQESESLGRYRYICGPLTVDYQLERVFKNGEDMHLTNIEYQIVALISRASGKVLTYQTIIAGIWGPYADAENNRILRVNMANIRRKIEENPASPKYIFTEVGVGYRMAPEKRPDMN